MTCLKLVSDRQVGTPGTNPHSAGATDPVTPPLYMPLLATLLTSDIGLTTSHLGEEAPTNPKAHPPPKLCICEMCQSPYSLTACQQGLVEAAEKSLLWGTHWGQFIDHVLSGLLEEIRTQSMQSFTQAGVEIAASTPEV